MSGFWNTPNSFKVSTCYTVIRKCQSIFILYSFSWRDKETLEHLMYCKTKMSWFLLLVDKYLGIPSKYSNTMLSICKISLRKISNTKSRWRWSNANVLSLYRWTCTKERFSYLIDKIVSLRRKFLKALVNLSWFLLLFLFLFSLIVYISLAFQLEVFQSELFRISIE